MKIHISSDPAERKEANAAICALRRLFPSARVHEKDDNAGKNHTYLTTRKPETP